MHNQPLARPEELAGGQAKAISGIVLAQYSEQKFLPTNLYILFLSQDRVGVWPVLSMPCAVGLSSRFPKSSAPIPEWEIPGDGRYYRC